MNRRQTFELSDDSNVTSYGQKPAQKYTWLFKALFICGTFGQSSSALGGFFRNDLFVYAYKEQHFGRHSEVQDCKIKQSESQIMQSKRWLSSKWTDWETFFAPYVQVLLSKIAEQKGELIFVIDGSETAADCVTLMLLVIWKGMRFRSLAHSRRQKRTFQRGGAPWLTRYGSKNCFPEMPGRAAGGWRIWRIKAPQTV